jgi:two-component system OmpR family sensor kinase
MKLRHRLSISATAVTAVALVSSFVVVHTAVESDELRDLDKLLLVKAQNTAKLAELQGEQAAADDRLFEFPDTPKPLRRWIVLYDRHHQIVVHTKTFGEDAPRWEDLGIEGEVPPSGVPVDLRPRGNHLRGVVIPCRANGGKLLFALSRRFLDKDLSFLRRLFLFILLGALAFTVVASQILGARLSRDVDAIAKVARAVASGDLSARLQGPARGSTETRHLWVDLNHMVSELEALMTTQRRFISHAAHELRSPLTALRGELQLALRRERSAEEYRETIQDALGDIELLSALAEDLLTLARIQQRTPAIESTTVAETVGEAIRMARGNAEARAVELRIVGDPGDGIRIPGGRNELARAIRNLVDNGLSHSPPQGVVTIAVTVQADRVQIEVTDQGEGVSPEDAPHVFAPFYRGATARSRDAGGSGLGLSIARELALAHGGDLYFDAAHRPGARFVLELPRLPPEKPC